MERDPGFFTLVFEGDIRSFKANPFKTETVFGIPVAAGIGNAFEHIDTLEEQLEIYTKAAHDATKIADSAIEKLKADR